MSKLLLATAALGVTIGIAVDRPVLFGNFIAIVFLFDVFLFLLGFCLAIGEARIDSRSSKPDDSRSNWKPTGAVQWVRRTERYAWLLLAYLVLAAFIFHPNHIGFVRHVDLLLIVLISLSLALVGIFLFPVTIIYVVKPSPTVLAELARLHCIGWAKIAAWWFLSAIAA